VTLVPSLIPIFIKGKLKSEEENAIVRSFIHIYKPLLTWALPRRNLVMWMFAALLILAAGMFPLQALIGLGASENAWRTMFLGVFALVTTLTVKLTTGKSGSDSLFLLLAFGLVAIAAVFAWLGAQSGTSATLRQVCFLLAVGPLLGLFVAAISTHHVVLRQTVTLVSLALLGLWASHFQKIGVAFMPALDEGTTLDMPITVPRASVTQSADDLKARDALLRGFPEVESVIGKAGRADTPTDPAPLDMVETFVNFRPKELWPKRVLKFDDALWQTDEVWKALEKQGFLNPSQNEEERQNLLNDPAQKALERFDETLRELALSRYVEFEHELERLLTRFAIEESIRKFRKAVPVHWPDPQAEQSDVERLTTTLTPEFGRWLARSLALEDVNELTQRVAGDLHEQGVIEDSAAALQLAPKSAGRASVMAQMLRQLTEDALGSEHQTFAGESLHALTERRSALWNERVHHTNWELFDHGTEAFTTYALEEIAKAGLSAKLTADAPRVPRSSASQPRPSRRSSTATPTAVRLSRSWTCNPTL